MNYAEVVDAALNYADRTDAKTAASVDSFLRIVESRVNRVLKTQKMTSRATLPTVKDQRYYGLPSDFNGLRDIQINGSLQDGHAVNITMHYLSPEKMNNQTFDLQIKQRDKLYRDIYYTIIADQLQISPTQEDNEIEIVYYQKLPALSDGSPDNWLSAENPDCYVFGLITEISAYAKDAEAKALWDQRFNEALAQIGADDTKSRWSGTPLQMRV